jgi:hypothetical protein
MEPRGRSRWQPVANRLTAETGRTRQNRCPSLLSAIRRIGGAEAVAGYDELMGSSNESAFRFMRASRGEVVQDVLNQSGQTLAPVVAASLGMPFIGGPRRTRRGRVIVPKPTNCWQKCWQPQRSSPTLQT